MASKDPENRRARYKTDEGSTQPEPVPGWRKPPALIGWGVLIAILIGVNIYGVVLLSQDSGSEPATTTTTTATTTSPSPSTTPSTTAPTPTTTTESAAPSTSNTTTAEAPPTSSRGVWPHWRTKLPSLPR